MDRDRFADIACSIARASGLVADPWTMLILRDLFLGLHRYDELRRDLGIATNVLADRLERLVIAGLATRTPYQDAPTRYEYQLTRSGRDLFGVLLAVMAWGDAHLAPDGPPLSIVHRSCGQHAVPTVVCDHCGGTLADADVDVAAGPGGRHAPGTALIAERLAAEG